MTADTLTRDVSGRRSRRTVLKGGAALAGALAALPGTQNLGRTTDRHGRTGTELAFRNGADRQHIVVDPGTGDLLQFDFDGTKGERLGAVLDAGWTDTLPR